MDPAPLTPFAMSVSFIGSVVSLVPCVTILLTSIRSPLLRSLPARLPLHSIAINAVWAILHIISICLSIAGISLPCTVLGPINHFFTVASILWFAMVFVSIQRTISGYNSGYNAKNAAVNSIVTPNRSYFHEEIQYVVVVTCTAVIACVFPLLVDVGVLSSGNQQFINKQDVYVTMANGICYIAPHYSALRVATVTSLAVLVFMYMAIAAVVITCRMRPLSVSQAVKNNIKTRIARYLIAFTVIWVLWIVEDFMLVSGKWNVTDMPKALEGCRAILFYSQGAFPSIVYGVNKWSSIRPLMPRWFVGIMSKVAWIVGLLSSVFPCNGGDEPDGYDAGRTPPEEMMAEGGDAWDIAGEVAEAIEAALPKRRTINSEISLHHRNSRRTSLEARLLDDQSENAHVGVNTPPIAIPTSGTMLERAASEKYGNLGADAKKHGASRPSSYTRSNIQARSYRLAQPSCSPDRKEVSPFTDASGSAPESSDSASLPGKVREPRKKVTQYRGSPLVPSAGHLGRSHGSQSSLSGAEESDLGALNFFGSKSKDIPQRKPTKAEEMTPTRGHPVHVYHIGSYNSASSMPTSVDLGLLKGDVAKPASMPFGSMASRDDRQFHVGYEEELGVSLSQNPPLPPYYVKSSPHPSENSGLFVPASYQTEGTMASFQPGTSFDPHLYAAVRSPEEAYSKDIPVAYGTSMSNVVFRVHTDEPDS